MALKRDMLKREFVMEHNGIKTTLPDPDPNLSPDAVMTFYSNTYPELTTSSCSGPFLENDKNIYKFKSTVGVKG